VRSTRSETGSRKSATGTYCRKSSNFSANLVQEHGEFVEVQLVVGIRIIKVKQGANL
jgi:hypothetical protein